MQSEKSGYINKNLLPDTYSFENFLEYNGLYVDKTMYYYKLISSGKRLFFFSRPRRFGKSLTISTLKAIFQGKKELFKGLYIENQPYEWKKYPVIHLDMGSVTATKAEELESDLINLLKRQAEKYNIELNGDRASQKFIELVQKLYDRDGEVVILIDEYDKPILNNILSPDIERIQTLLKGFYSVLKTCEPYERFVFLTGVGKFLKVSIFSDLNNLNDISMSKEYAAMCGYTEDEIEEYFHERLAKIALEQETDYDDLNRSIKDWYDGYRFSRGEQRVYNPVSFTKFLSEDGEFSNYWFATGTPSILVRLFKENCVDFEKLFNEYQMEDVFTAFMPAKVKFVALMYQTGYLTIKDTRTILKRTTYKLGFPNIEVEESFYRYLFSELNNKDGLGDSLYLSLIDALIQNDIDKMMSVIDAYLADLPYGIQIAHEKYYQTIFYLLFNLIGTTIHAEVQTSDGRIDAVVEYGENVYIFEFKLNKTEEIAFDQIMEKQYYKAYQHHGKQITLIGANFNSETRRISGWKKLELKK